MQYNRISIRMFFFNLLNRSKTFFFHRSHRFWQEKQVRATSYDLFEQIWTIDVHVSISGAMYMRSCFCSKFSNFGTVFAAARLMPETAVKIVCYYANIISNLSNSDSTIIHNHFVHCFKVFIGCWSARATRTSIVIDIFSTFFKPVIPQLNLYSAYSTYITL